MRTRTSEITVNLQPGWNAVGFQGLRTLSLSTTSPGLAFFANGAYQFAPVADLEGRRGYWVFANEAGPLTYVAEGEAEGLELAAGWNLVASASTRSVLPSPELPLVRARDGATVSEMAPGEAYWMFASSPTTVSWKEALAPSAATVAVTGTQVFTFTGGRPSWTSDRPEVATITAEGVATGVSPGQATITAAFQGRAYTASLTVTQLATNPPPPLPALPAPTPFNFRTVGSTGTLHEIAGRVAVGVGAMKLTRDHGATWQVLQATNTTLYGVATDGTSYVAVGDSGRIETSSDGVEWTQRTSPTGASLKTVTYGGGQWVAAGDAGVILTSPDSVTWTLQDSSSGAEFNCVRYLNGLYVACGTGRDLRTSPDGITWTGRLGSLAYDGVAYGHGVWVAGGILGQIARSLDGTTWTNTGDWGSAEDIRGLVFANGQFVAVGVSGKTKTSPDGLTWTEQASATTIALNGLGWDGTNFIAVGDTGVVQTSPDGLAWTRTVVPEPSLFAVATDGQLFVAVGEGGAIRTSPDGSTWTTRVAPLAVPYQAVTWTGTQFVAVSRFGAVDTSPDGITWTTRVVPTIGSSDLLAVTHGASVCVAVGRGGTILRSTDLVTFTPVTSPTSRPLNGVAFGAGRFVTLNDQGQTWTSPDAQTWTPAASLTPRSSLVQAGGVFLAGGLAGALASSADGLTWTPRTTNFPGDIYALTHGYGGYVIVGEQGRASTSTDLVTWTPLPVKVGRNYLRGAVGTGSRYVLVGESGSLVTSP